MAGSARCGLAQAGWALAALMVGVSALTAGGCGKQADIHPALRVEGEDLERATKRGCSLISLGADPYEAYASGLQEVNARVSPDVLIREAGCCWPQEEVAFQIAQRGDSSDAGVKRAVREALKTIEHQLKFTVVLQMPKERDPATVDFALQTGTGVEYPPLEIGEPYYLRDAKSYYNPEAPPSALYQYVVIFPIRGGPGIPPIGPHVSELYLVVRDGDAEANAWFRMPYVRTKR